MAEAGGVREGRAACSLAARGERDPLASAGERRAEEARRHLRRPEPGAQVKTEELDQIAAEAAVALAPEPAPGSAAAPGAASPTSAAPAANDEAEAREW